MAWTRDSDGWTVFTPKTDGTSSTNTWVYYVDPDSDGVGATGYEATNTGTVGSDPFQPVGSPVTYNTLSAARSAALSRRNPGSNWLLVKRGTTIDASYAFDLSGESYDAIAMLGAYGAGARPIIKLGVAGDFNSWAEVYWAMSSIHFYDTLKDPDHADWAGFPTHPGRSLRLLYQNKDFLLEDCRFQFAQLNIQRVTNEDPLLTNVEVRRCGMGPNYGTLNGGHAQCMFVDSTDGLLVEDVYAYSGGWYDNAALDATGETAHNPTVYNRNFYIAQSPNTVMRNVISARSATSSVQLRNGGTFEYSVDTHNPMGVAMGHPENVEDWDEVAIRYSLCEQLEQNGVASFGSGFSISDPGTGSMVGSSVTFHENIITPQKVNHSQGGVAMAFDPSAADFTGVAVNITDNIVYDFDAGSPTGAGAGIYCGGSDEYLLTATGNDLQSPTQSPRMVEIDRALPASLTLSGNTYNTQKTSLDRFDINAVSKSFAQWVADTGDTSSESTESYTDPDRTVVSYATANALGATIEQFMLNCLDINRQDGWDWAYSAYAVIDHVRAGFDKSQLTGGNVSGSYIAWRDGTSTPTLSVGGSYLVLGV